MGFTGGLSTKKGPSRLEFVPQSYDYATTTLKECRSWELIFGLGERELRRRWRDHIGSAETRWIGINLG